MLGRRRPSFSLGWFFVGALALHLILTLLPVFHPAEKAIELTAYEEKPDQDRPVVQTEVAVEQADDDQPARFAGEVRNRVRRETQASRKGRFQQGQRVPTVPFSADSGDGDGAPEMPYSDLFAFPQTPNGLPDDIASGSQTLLNTDPVLYASFLNRVADEIYDAWVFYARRATDRVYAAGGRLSAAVYITKLTVVLNREGEVASLKILKASGVPALDEAPKEAFWDAEPFRNPPKQMFDDDGLVRFVYEFHFQWKSSGFNIVPLI